MDTSTQGCKTIQLFLKGRRQRQIQVVVVACFDVVHGIGTLSSGLFVGKVELVEIYLTVCFVLHQEDTCRLKLPDSSIVTVGKVVLIPNIKIARRHILPVVGLGIV